jgi:hypothetical protein
MTTTDRRCPNGHPIDASAVFCTQCGSQVTSSGSANRACPNGHELAPSDAFCTQCGGASLLSTPASAAGSVPSPPPGFASAGPYGVGTQGAPHLPPPYAPQYAPQYAPPYMYAQPQTTNGLAIASLVVSLCVFCGLNAIVAPVLGIVALNQIKSTNQNGRGLAIAGIVISGVQLALVLLWVILVIVLAHVGASSSSSLMWHRGPGTGV